MKVSVKHAMKVGAGELTVQIKPVLGGGAQVEEEGWELSCPTLGETNGLSRFPLGCTRFLQCLH